MMCRLATLQWETMLTEDDLDRVCVVLVRARNPSNIGAVARAMHDFGFRRLRVVNTFPVPFEAARSAVDASAVMAGAVGYASVAEAVVDCTLVVGTTAVGERDLRHDLLRLAEAAVRMRRELRRDPTHDGETVMNGAPVGSDGTGRVALLFGSEKTGLSNDEMSHCNWLLTVPMQEYEGVRHPSMNLGQAVAVCLYELVREADGETAGMNDAAAQVTDVGRPASAGELERLSALLSEVLEKTEYTRRHPAEKDPAQMRRMVRRMGAEADDAPVWMGILRQVLWKLGGKREE
jgi:TrmH family RNA methyltransferase